MKKATKRKAAVCLALAMLLTLFPNANAPVVQAAPSTITVRQVGSKMTLITDRRGDGPTFPKMQTNTGAWAFCLQSGANQPGTSGVSYTADGTGLNNQIKYVVQWANGQSKTDENYYIAFGNK